MRKWGERVLREGREGVERGEGKGERGEGRCLRNRSESARPVWLRAVT